jgi:hypothetical protein
MPHVDSCSVKAPGLCLGGTLSNMDGLLGFPY